MSKRTLVFASAAALLALIAGAFVLDSTRLAEQARSRVELADRELVKHELRLVKLLAAVPSQTPQIRSAITAYEAATDRSARENAYDNLVGALRADVAPAVDVNDPVARKFIDDVAGAINRRERAEPAYDAERAAYAESMNGLRGSVAKWFPPAAEESENAE